MKILPVPEKPLPMLDEWFWREAMRACDERIAAGDAAGRIRYRKNRQRAFALLMAKRRPSRLTATVRA